MARPGTSAGDRPTDDRRSGGGLLDETNPRHRLGGPRALAPRRRRRAARRGDARRPDHLGHPRVAGADLVRSRGDHRDRHAVPGHVRAPRRAGEAAARQPAGAEPRRVVDGLARRARVRVRAAQRDALPHRRPRDPGRRQVLLRALPRRRAEGLQGPRDGSRDPRREPRALPFERTVARLPDVLLERDRGGLDRAPKVRRESRRRGVQEGAGRRRAVPVRLASRRASSS